MGGGAWPFFLGEVICLVTSFDDLDVSIPNGVQYDSYLIVSWRDIVCIP